MYEYQTIDYEFIQGMGTVIICYFDGVYFGQWKLPPDGEYYFIDDSY